MSAQIISSLAQLAAVFIDGVVTGKVLGEQALASYGYCSPFVSIVVAFSGFILTGTAALMGRAVGSGDAERVTGVFSTGLTIAKVVGLQLTCVAMIFPSAIAHVAGAEGVYRAAAAQYLRGYGAGLIPSLMITFLIPILQLDGDKPRIFRTFLVMAGSDILLDLLNAYVLHLGLLGMGLATAAANWIAAVVMMMHFRGKTMFRFERKSTGMHYVYEISSFGIFYIVKQFFMAALVYFVNNYLTRCYGPSMVAVYAAINSAGGILFCVGTGIGSAVSVLTGVYAGEEDGDALRRMIKTALRYSLLLNGAVTLVVLLLAKGMIFLYFGTGWEYFRTAVTGLRLYALCTVIHSVDLTIRGYYQSMKMQKMSIFFGFLHNFACIALAMRILDWILGIRGVWLSWAAGETAALVILYAAAGLPALRNSGRFAQKSVRSTGVSRHLDRLLLIPASFEVPAKLMEVSLRTMEEVVEYSRQLQSFCLQEGADRRTANQVSLTVEELAGNVIRYGFTDGKKHSIDIRVTHKEDWIVRIRDDCNRFDPVAFFEDDSDRTGHIGLRMIMKQVKSVQYMNTLDLNNLIVRIG